MSETPAPNTLYTALLAAQSAMGRVGKDASNPAFRSKYATLQSVLDTIEGPLHANGLLVVQRLAASTTEKVDDAPVLFLVTDLIHAPTGTKIESITPVTCKDPHDPQKVGGALTYYRRYSLLALFNLGTEDDDGNHAAQVPQAPRRETPPQTRSQPPGAIVVPAQAPQELTAPAGDWTTVWTLAKERGIHTQAALTKALGANAGAMDPATIVKELRAIPVPSPAFAG